MNPYDEEGMKQEVIYLHSLWHQGPPTRNPNPNGTPIQNPILHPYQRPRPNYIPPADLHFSGYHGPVRTQQRPRNTKARSQNDLHHHPYKRSGLDAKGPDPGPEWPVKAAPPTPRAASGREFKPNPGQKARSMSGEEQARSYTAKLQKDVLQTCREFFAGKSCSEDGDGEDRAETDEGEEDYLLENDGSEENEEFKFFSRLFNKNGELKGYYEKNHANGEFSCLVCGSTEEKIGRKFNSCLALVQHSLAIYKTKMTKAHRAFAQVVCDFLGWDINNPLAGNTRQKQSSSKEDGGSKHAENPQSGTSDAEARIEGTLDCQGSGASTSASVEWPSRWPSKPKKTPVTHSISAEEQARITTLQIQQKASEACKDFFSRTLGSDTEYEEEDNDVDPIDNDAVSEESEEFKFLSRVFLENNDLRSYYEKNYQSGDFVCVVCAGIGKKVWKRFKDCSGLLQHSIKVLNTKKKRAHRVFARVVCEIFGWDFNRIPMIVAKGDHPNGDTNVKQNDGTSANNEVTNVDNETLDEEANKCRGRN